MPSALPAKTAFSIRTKPVLKHPSKPSTANHLLQPRKLKHRPCASSDQLSVDGPSLTLVHEPLHRPSKRPMPNPTQTIAVVNSSGRQAASFIRVASAVGYHVRAQLRNLDGIVATEISELPNVEVLVGELYAKPSDSSSQDSRYGVNHDLIKRLFQGTQLAFINTTFWGDEVAIGKALADAAVAAKTQHYIYSTMPDHSLQSTDWPSLPLWSSKSATESYIRSLPTLFSKTTFLYTGIYNNNFTSLPYPLFCMELQTDGSFIWHAPFHPDVSLPWLDAEHDVGPAVLQIFKDGISRWGNGERVALAYEMLSPREACKAFARGLGRPVKYKRESKIAVKVSIPRGYQEQLLALEKMYALSATDPDQQPPYFGTKDLESSCPKEAQELWEGHRGLEEYAREVFPLEEAANGLTWMNHNGDIDGVWTVGRTEKETDIEADGEDDDEDEGLTMGGGLTGSAGEGTPARKEETWLA